MNKKNDKKNNDFALISEVADGYIFGVVATDLELIGGGLSGDCETRIGEIQKHVGSFATVTLGSVYLSHR